MKKIISLICICVLSLSLFGCSKPENNVELKKLHTMKKTTFLKIVLLIFVFLQHFNSYSQNYIPFAPRYNQDIKGDMLL